LYQLERGDFATGALGAALDGASCTARKIVVAAMAKEAGFSRRAIAQHLDLARGTVRSHLEAYAAGDVDTLIQRKLRPHKADNENFKKALFGLLHEPPSLSGYNRTSWRLEDLRQEMAKRGEPACRDVIRQVIRKAGFRWKAAKVVLTSTDPEYREKLAHVQNVLSNLGDDERFFSVDEYGPFAVKAKAGRLLAGPDDHPSVAQWQKSKGWLILTAAVELSQNRVTHFYSRAKNTTEMIRLATILLGMVFKTPCSPQWRECPRSGTIES
jgi:transposase